MSTRSKKARSQRVKITLSPEEYTDLLKESYKEGQKIATYVKTAALTYLARSYLFPQGVDLEMRTFTLVLRGAANNLNQIAHIANRNGHIPQEEFVRLRLQVRNMEEMVNRFIRYLYNKYACQIYEPKNPEL